MGFPKNISGRRYGKLTAVQRVSSRITPSGQRKSRWECICECGKTVNVDYQCLTDGKVRSCGCASVAMRVAKQTKHGMTRTKEYRAWSHAKGRCYDRNDPRYRLYGARGITMCKTWRDDFSVFLSDMGRAPAGFTLERLNVSDGYNPRNCVWANRTQQANNTRANSIVELDGKRMTLSECARKYGVKYKSLHHFYHTRKGLIHNAVQLATKV